MVPKKQPLVRKSDHISSMAEKRQKLFSCERFHGYRYWWETTVEEIDLWTLLSSLLNSSSPDYCWVHRIKPNFLVFLGCFHPQLLQCLAQDADGCDWTLARATQGITLWWELDWWNYQVFCWCWLVSYVWIVVVCCTIHPRSWDQPDRHGEPMGTNQSA